MASRSIAIKITVDNQGALNATKAQILLTKELDETVGRQAKNQILASKSIEAGTRAELAGVKLAIAEQRLLADAVRKTAKEKDGLTHVQAGLTNSFIKGNLAARAISETYLSIKNTVGFAIGGAMDLELTLARVSAVTGASKEEMADLEETIFKLGRTTSSSTADIAAASLELSKLGFSSTQLELALEGVSRLSSILGDSLESTGKLVGGVVNTFHLSAAEAATVADKLFVATGKSAASIESFSVAFGLAGSTAASAGLTFEELAASVAALSQQGIRGSTIGTGLRNFLINLSLEGSNANKVLGGSVRELGLLGSIQKLAEINPDEGSIFKMFGKPGSPVASSLKEAKEMYESFLAAVKNGDGSLKVGGDLINETLRSEIIRLKNATVEMFKVWGDAPSGIVKTFFGAIADGLHDISDQGKLAERVAKFRKEDPVGSLASDKEATTKMWQSNKASLSPLLMLARGMTGRETVDDLAASQTKAFILYEGKQQIAKNKKQAQEAEQQKALLALTKSDPGGGKALDFEDKKTKSSITKVLKPVQAMAISQKEIAGHALWEEDKAGGPKQSKAQDKTIKPVQAMAISQGEMAGHIAMAEHIAEIKKQTLEAVIAAQAFQTSVMGVNGSFEILSKHFTDGLFGAKDPFKGITDSFGNFAKKMAADLLALTMKILFFKGVLALIGMATPGVGAVATPFVRQLASATTGVKFASGTDQVVTKATNFTAGESGYERVTVTPRAKMSAPSPSGGITVVIQGDVLDGAKFADAVELAQKRLKGRTL